MLIEQLIVTLVVLLLITLIAEPLSRLTRLPFTSLLVVLGFIISEIIVYAGFDTGLRAENFQTLIFYVFIPLLVFESAFYINKRQLFANLLPVLFLAVLGMVMTCVIAAVLLYYGIGHATGFPWIAALLTGAILAATDPVAVVARLKDLHAPERLSVLLEGESLFNDATAIVLFTLFLSLAVSMTESPDAEQSFNIINIVLSFALVFLGGAIVGSATGFVCALADRFSVTAITSVVLTLVATYASYLVAEHLHVSGVMGSLGAGLVMSLQCRRQCSKAVLQASADIWSFMAYVANAIVFIIVGAVITISMFEQRWLAMLIAIVAILVARAISTYGGLGLLSLVQKQPVSLRDQSVMVWGGLRGAVTLALALSLPVSLPYWWTIQSIAFGVVLFTLFIQATTISVLVSSPDRQG